MSRHLVSTAAAVKSCPGCGTTTLKAIDEGLTVIADAQPIPGTEVEILLTGLRTYTFSSGKYLTYRDADRIAGGYLHGTIHAQHRCPQPTLT